MKVKDLIEKLKECDPEDLVVMSADAEGNGHSELADVETNQAFDGDSVGIKELNSALIDFGYTEEDLCDGESCIVLYRV